MIAALYVMPKGVYSNREGVDAWDKDRDAKKYDGPYPVVAHPPCARWGRYWNGGPAAKVKKKLGDDDGCFQAALASVLEYGGVLEHPEGSKAWPAHGINKPPRRGGWVAAIEGRKDAWTCCVEQGHYGHRARKMTWLLYCGSNLPPELAWGPSSAGVEDLSGLSLAERKRRIKTGVCQKMSKNQRMATPEEFAELLIALAKESSKHA